MRLREYATRLGVSYLTAYNHWKKGLIKGFQLETGTIIVEFEETKQSTHKRVVLYARVSSSENKDNLEAQLTRLRNFAIAKGYTIVKEIQEVGSGLNDKRRKLLAQLKLKDWDILLVEHKDRLARFGIELIETLLAQLDKKIEVINQAESQRADILQDLISIITSYSAKIYGLRRSKRQTEKITALLQADGQTVRRTQRKAPGQSDMGQTGPIVQHLTQDVGKVP